MLRQYNTGRWMCHLEARALWLIHIQGLQVRAPFVDQLVVVVVVLAGHLRGLVLMGLIHVNNLHNMFSKAQQCCACTESRNSMSHHNIATSGPRCSDCL